MNFKTTLDFYVRAYMAAVSQDEKEKLRPYLRMATKDRKSIAKTEGYKPLDENVILKQKESIDRTLDMMCANLSPAEPVEGVSCLNELDFRLRQEVTNAGWTLTEKEGKVVICVYLP